MLDIVLILIFATLVFKATRHGLSEGFPLAAACLVTLPGQLRIESPGSLPEITVHRILLAILFLRWSQAPRTERPPIADHLNFLLILAVLARVVSNLLSITPAASVKDLLSFTFESVVYYHLACFALTTAASRDAVVRAVIRGLVVVALIGFVERYSGVSLPLVAISGFKYCYDGIQSTYSHRILLGYAMAMGTPLVLHLLDAAASARERRVYWLALTALVVVCFLADSRGGWIGMAIGGMLSLVTGSGSTRKRCIGLLFLAGLTLVVRPGIRETILARIQDTYSTDSYKGVSYQYRWRLWHVAFSELGKSPERLLFGYGGLSTESMNLSHYFPPQEGGAVTKTGFTSWDNHYASDLIEFGVVGLGIELLIFGAILLRLARHWWIAPPDTRPLIGAALVSSIIYVFARTNVYIFGEQLKFLFWTIVAVGTTAARPEPIPPMTAEVPLPASQYTDEPIRA